MRRVVRVGLWAGLAGALTVGLLRAARWFRDVGTPPPPATWPTIPEPVDPDTPPTASPHVDPPSAKSAPPASEVAAPLDDDAPAPAPVYEPVPDPVAEPIDGACPASHPVKGKASSGLYHLPGMVAYARTNADSCFVDAEAAEAAGFTRAKH